MATFLDAIGTLQEFSVIFTFILVLVVVYGLFQYTKLLGDNKAVHALISLAVAFLFLFSQTASDIIKIMVPWFVILFSALLFLLVGIKMFGAKGAEIDFWTMIKDHSSISWWILAISLIIIIGAITTVYSEKGRVFGEGGAIESGDGGVSKSGEAGTVGKAGFWGTITHPKVLGLIAILLIASYTVRYMAKIKD